MKPQPIFDGISMGFIEHRYSTTNPSNFIEEREYTMTIDVHLWKECMDCNDKYMDNNMMPPFFPNDISYDESTDDTSWSDRSLKVCFPVIVKPICLANDIDNENDDSAYSFVPPSSEFWVNNCATYHICSEKSLFVGEISKVQNIGVRGVVGLAIAEEIRTIPFTINDPNGTKYNIVIDNGIHLPTAVKNLI